MMVVLNRYLARSAGLAFHLLFDLHICLRRVHAFSLRSVQLLLQGCKIESFGRLLHHHIGNGLDQ